jgi:hypothetical protein
MGLYKGKVQRIFMSSYILLSADDKRRINVSRERGKKVIYQEAQYTSSWPLGLKS